MNKQELEQILNKHKLWLESKEGGECADLSNANLSYAVLRDADLRNVNLSYADLSYATLSGANLTNADLSYAQLSYANLSDADLTFVDATGVDAVNTIFSSANFRRAVFKNANLQNAILSRVDTLNANFEGADLTGVNIDYGTLPIWCGGSRFKADNRFVAQILAHLCSLDVPPEARAELDKIIDFARTSHRAHELGIIKETNEHFLIKEAINE